MPGCVEHGVHCAYDSLTSWHWSRRLDDSLMLPELVTGDQLVGAAQKSHKITKCGESSANKAQTRLEIFPRLHRCRPALFSDAAGTGD